MLSRGLYKLREPLLKIKMPYGLYSRGVEEAPLNFLSFKESPLLKLADSNTGWSAVGDKSKNRR